MTGKKRQLLNIITKADIRLAQNKDRISMQNQNDEIVVTVEHDIFKFSLDIVEMEGQRIGDPYLNKLSYNMRSTRVLREGRPLKLEDCQILVDFLQEMQDANERPYLQDSIDALLVAMELGGDEELVDANSQ